MIFPSNPIALKEKNSQDDFVCYIASNKVKIYNVWHLIRNYQAWKQAGDMRQEWDKMSYAAQNLQIIEVVYGEVSKQVKYVLDLCPP